MLHKHYTKKYKCFPKPKLHKYIARILIKKNMELIVETRLIIDIYKEDKKFIYT